MIANIFKTLGICLTSLNSFNIQTSRAETTYTIKDISGQKNEEIKNRYKDNYLNFSYWEYAQNTETATETNVKYTATQKKQALYHEGGADEYMYAYPNQSNPVMITYLLIKMETIPNAVDYFYLKEARACYNGLLDSSGSINMKGGIITSYETTWDQYLNTSMTENPQQIYNEVNTMINSYIESNTQFENREINNQNTNAYNDMLQDRTINLSKNPQVPLYILMYLYIEPTNLINPSTPLNYNYIDIDYIEITYGTNNSAIITQEVIDIPGLAFTILAMPFTFISTAFNLTIFPGTPYQVNISTLFLAILGVIFFIFILKIVLGKVK